MNPWGAVEAFHRAFGVPIGSSWGDPDRQALRLSLIEEELEEYRKAMEVGDLVAVADALGDLVYVVAGTAVEYGIPGSLVFDEIHRSNMAKLGPDGKPILREDGKVLKPEGWTPPDLAQFFSRR